MKMISNFGIFYRLLVLSTIIFLFGCQAPPDTDNNVIKPPEWITQKPASDFNEAEYYSVVGVSNKSFDDARSRAFEEIRSKIIENMGFSYVENHQQKQTMSELILFVSALQDDYTNAKNKKKATFLSDLKTDYMNVFNNVLLDETLVEAQRNNFHSWAELFTVPEKEYTDGFTYYVMLRFKREKMIDNRDGLLIDIIDKNNKSYVKLQKNSQNKDFEKFLQSLYRMIDLYQSSALRMKGDQELSSDLKKEIGDLKNIVDKNILTLFRDFEVRFSEDNVKGWRDKFTDKIDIQIFWKKNLIKIPLRFETSTDAQVELIESSKDDVSYELRVMPLSASNRTNTSGQHFIEFDLKPVGLRFSKLINFALKRKFHFTLPTKKNSNFQLVVNHKLKDKSNSTKIGFAENLCKSFNEILNDWCETYKYKVVYPQQTQQTQAAQNIYDFKVMVDFVDVDIVESRGMKILTVDMDFKLMYFDDSIDKPGWVRLKQDNFKYSDDLILKNEIDDRGMFALFCIGLFQEPDFEKVIGDLFQRAKS